MTDWLNSVTDERARDFYCEWAKANGVVARPTVEQLLEMNEAFICHQRRWEQARAGKGFRDFGRSG